MTLPPGTAPGWHSDPGGAPMLRWWDGSGWTENVTAMPDPAAITPTTDNPFAQPAAYNLGYAPGGMAGYPAPVQTGTSGLAIASLICGLVGFLCCSIVSIAAIVCGAIALNQLGRPESRETGRGLAIAGIVLGGVGFIVSGLILISFVTR